MEHVKHIIHIHQQKMRKGDAAIIDRTYLGSTHHRQLEIVCPCGCDQIAATIVQSDTPDRCGARVWIETTATSIPAPTESPHQIVAWLVDELVYPFNVSTTNPPPVPWQNMLEEAWIFRCPDEPADDTRAAVAEAGGWRPPLMFWAQQPPDPNSPPVPLPQ